MAQGKKERMSASSDWRRSVANGIGIVLSILLAFAIDAAWDARTERLQRDALLDGLRQEFTVNLGALDVMVARFQQEDSLLLHFFGAPPPVSEEEAEAAVRRFTLAILWADDFDPSMASLEMILGGDTQDLLFRTDLGALLWTWKRQFEDTQDDVGAFSLFIQDGRRILTELGARGVRPDLRPPWSQQFDRMRSSYELSALAQTILIDREEYWTELQALRGTTAKVLATLE